MRAMPAIRISKRKSIFPVTSFSIFITHSLQHHLLFQMFMDHIQNLLKKLKVEPKGREASIIAVKIIGISSTCMQLYGYMLLVMTELSSAAIAYPTTSLISQCRSCRGDFQLSAQFSWFDKTSLSKADMKVFWICANFAIVSGAGVAVSLRMASGWTLLHQRQNQFVLKRYGISLKRPVWLLPIMSLSLYSSLN